MPITPEARRDFVENVTGLSLELAGRRGDKLGAFGSILTAQTPVFRLTSLWDGVHHPAHGWDDPEWRELLERLSMSGERGLDVLLPLVLARIEQDVARWPWIPSGLGVEDLSDRLFGMFLYEVGPGGKEDTLDLHMGNSLSPASPFRDAAARRLDLLALLDDAQQRYPLLEQIESTSWMNTFQPFLQLFPASWQQSASRPIPLQYTYGWWGQLVSRTGAFHRENGEHLHRTGRFRYPCVACTCTIDALRRHLATTPD